MQTRLRRPARRDCGLPSSLARSHETAWTITDPELLRIALAVGI